MKEFNKTNKVTYNLMSFTGFKSLLIFSMLLESPKSYHELKEAIRNHEYLNEDISIDSLRVYINSLKKFGCKIKRNKTSDGWKYFITSHPFEFKIDEEQVKSLIKIYKIILKTLDIRDIYIYEKFLKKLAISINSKDLIDAIEKISIFRGLDIEIVEKLIKYAKINHKIKVLYDSPNSKSKEVEFIADKLAFVEGKLYIYGISLKYQQATSYLVQRIKKIIDVDIENETNIDIKKITVGYELFTSSFNARLSEDEKIVEIKKDSIIVETETTNLFMMKRKILEYGENCVVLYPETFRNEIIDTLKNMNEVYNND